MSYDDAGIRCTMLRGGTSRGLYFETDDLPADPAVRDALLLRLMGSPDARQIDGLGGATSLTSKVAIIQRTIIGRLRATSGGYERSIFC